jgi:hypothetical protein
VTTGTLVRDARQDWLIVGSPDEWFTPGWEYESLRYTLTDVRVGMSAGIGQASAFCINLVQEPQIGDQIAVEVTKPNGAQETIAYTYDVQPAYRYDGMRTKQITVDILQGDGATTSLAGSSEVWHDDIGVLLVQSDQSEPFVRHTLIYYHLYGSPPGVYSIALRVNQREMARETLKVDFCDCPTIRLFDNRGRALRHTDGNLSISDQINIMYTGFRPNTPITTTVFKKVGQLGRSEQYEASHAWTTVADNRGEVEETIDIDANVAIGKYIFRATCATNCASMVPVAIHETEPGTAATSPQPITGAAPTQGMQVVAVEPDSVAARAGMNVGQILVRLAGQPITSVDDVRAIVAQHRHRVIDAVVWGDGAEQTLTLALTDGPIGVDLCAIGRCLSASRAPEPVTGMRIVAVDAGSPAADAGLEVGWIVIRLGDQFIENVTMARDIAQRASGRSVDALIWDGVTTRTVQIVPRDGVLGVDLCDLATCR